MVQAGKGDSGVAQANEALQSLRVNGSAGSAGIGNQFITEPPSTAPSTAPAGGLRPLRVPRRREGKGNIGNSDRLTFGLGNSPALKNISPLEYLRMRHGLGQVDESRSLWPQNPLAQSHPELMYRQKMQFFVELNSLEEPDISNITCRPSTVGTSSSSPTNTSYCSQGRRSKFMKVLPPLNFDETLSADVFEVERFQFDLEKTIPVRKEHMDLLGLPYPLNRIYLLLPRSYIPRGLRREDLDAVGASRMPNHAFAQVLVGDADCERLIKTFDGYSMRHPGPCSAMSLAAMTALVGQHCQHLVLGSVEDSERTLKLLSLWPKLKSISYRSESMSGLSAFNDLSNLESLDLRGMGGHAKDFSSLKLPKLKHLTISESHGVCSGADLPECPCLESLHINMCAGIQNLDGIKCVPSQKMSVQHCKNLASIEGMLSDDKDVPPEMEFCWNDKLARGIDQLAQGATPVRLLDVRGCRKLHATALLDTARSLKAGTGKGSMLVSPAQCCGFPPEVLTLAEQAELRLLATEAIKVKLEKLDEKVKDLKDDGKFREAQNVLGDSLRLLRETYAPAEEIDKVQSEILNVRVQEQVHENPEGFDALLGKYASEDDRRRSKEGGLQRFRKAVYKVKMFSPRRVSVDLPDAVAALVDLGFANDEAAMLCDYIDCERKGFITQADMHCLFEGCSPATMHEISEFYTWIADKYGSVDKAFSTFATYCVHSNGNSLSFLEMEHVVQKEGWKKTNTRSIFTCLNAGNQSGSLTRVEFSMLTLFASLQQLKLAEDLVAFLIRKYKSLEKAFKKIDDNQSGAVSVEELKKALAPAYKPADVGKNVFRFIDVDNSGILDQREFLGLQDLNAKTFIKNLRKLQERMYMEVGSIEQTFAEIDAGSPDGFLTIEEFVHYFKNQLRLQEFSKLDPRVLFAFLNRGENGGGDGKISREEFMKLKYFAAEASQSGVKRVRDRLISRFHGDAEKAFARLNEKPKKAKQDAIPVTIKHDH